MDRIEDRIRTLQNGLKFIDKDNDPEFYRKCTKELDELLSIKNREVTVHV